MNEIQEPVEGTVVDWPREIQVHPKTGQCFDFNGKLLEGGRHDHPIVRPEPSPAPVPEPAQS